MNALLKSETLPAAWRKKKKPTASGPLEDIPPEIISQFLLFYLDTLGRGKVREGLLNICLTCKDWRDIVYAIPELWANLDIIVKSTSKESSLTTLEAWLSRSRQVSLTISFVVDGYGPVISEGQRRLANVILDMLFFHVHRWSSISFSFSLDPYVGLPIFYKNIRAPLLESMEISIHPSTVPHTQWFATLMGRAPKLYTFIDKSPRQTVSFQAIPFSQLSVIKLRSSLPPVHALQIIEQMPMLKVCHIAIEVDTDADPSARPVICYATSLRVTVRVESKSFLQRLVVPNLEEFEFHTTTDEHSPSLQSSLVAFLRRTAGQIISFAIRNLFMRDEELLDCLRILSPRLMKLEILADSLSPREYWTVENFTERVISALTYDPEVPPDEILCPKLEILTLERCIDAEDGFLASMIKSRWSAYRLSQNSFSDSITKPDEHVFSGIYFFNVVFRYHSHPDDTNALDSLRKKGLGGVTEFGQSRRITEFTGYLDV